MAKDCVQEILKNFKGISKAEAEALVGAMSKERRAAFEEGMGNPMSEYRKRAQEILNNYRYEVNVEKARRIENITKRQMLKSEITALGDTPEAAREGLLAKLVGSSKRIEGWGLSVDAIQVNNREQLFSGFLRDFHALGDEFLKIAKKGEIDREIMIERQQLNMKNGGKPGITGNDAALKIAKVYNNTENAIYGMVNSAGAFKRRLDGFAASVSHDQTKVGEDFDKWFQKIVPLLDEKKTFEGDFFKKDPREFLKTVWDDIRTGKSSRRATIDPAEDELIQMVGMPASFSKRIERSRVLHFKDASAQYEYHQEFGNEKSLFEQQVGLMTRTARDAGLMRVFGTNPEATAQALIRGLGIDAEGANLLTVNSALAEVMGKTLGPGESMMAKVGTVSRAIQTLSKLGGAVLSSFPDFEVKASTLRGNGIGFLESYQKSFGEFLNQIPTENRKRVALMIGTGSEHLVGTHFSSLGAADAKPGKLAQMHDLFFKMNGLTLWTQSHLAATSNILSMELGFQGGFKDIEPKLAQNLARYRIKEPHWDLISAGMETVEGNRYGSVSGVRELPDEVVLAAMEKHGLLNPDTPKAARAKLAQNFRQDTTSYLGTYFSDQSRIAQLEPGARERAILLRGTSADSLGGQVARYFAQFKAFPLAMITKGVSEVAYQNGALTPGQAFSGESSSRAAMASMMVSLTALGYLSHSAKNLVAGKTPPDPSHPDTWKEAFMRGGTGGIYGDYLLKEYNSRQGKSFLAALAGPVPSQINDLFDLKTKLMDPDVRESTKASNVLRTVVNNFPGGNLPYVRRAADHLFLYDMQERLNPGFQSRMEARMLQKGEKPLF